MATLEAARVTPAVVARTAPAAPIQGSNDGLPLGSFHVATLVFQRARQLQNGARPRVDGTGHRSTRLALLEVMADTISWTVG